MMSFSIRKSLISLIRNCSKYQGNDRHAFYFTKRDIAKHNQLLKVLHTPIRNVSSSSLAPTSDSNTKDNCPKDDQHTSVLNDEEFRSILNDFSKDFGVSSDSEQILDEIRQSLDEPTSDSDESQSQNPVEKCNVKDSSELNFSSTSNSKLNKSNRPGLKYVSGGKFTEYTESDKVFIPSHEELQSKADDEEWTYHVDQNNEIQQMPVEMKRGVTGVFDIDELIEVLKKENLEGITAISVPKELHYTDFLVIATAKSPRHSKAVAEKIVKYYKMKKHSKDPFVIVEGEKVSSEWKAIDMGNIVLHIFLEEMRALYDIESLWLFDAAFDRGGNQKHDPLYTEIEQQMAFFNALNEKNPQESNSKTT